MIKLNLPIRPWVPQWLGVVTMFVVLLPIILLNGAYTGSIVEASNTLGILSEDINMAYYATSVGMAVAYPIVPKIRAVVTTKTLLLTDLTLQVIISFLCGHAANMDIVVVKEIDGKSILIIASALLFTIYLFTYGKTLDWFASDRIKLYAVIVPILLWLFFHRQGTSTKPYFSIAPLSRMKSIIGYTFMMLTMFLSATSTLVTSYMNSIIKVDSIHANSLSLWMLPGFVCGAVICFWWFRWQRWRFRFLISGGLFCYVLYLGILYFGVTPYGTYEMLYLPLALRGMGLVKPDK